MGKTKIRANCKQAIVCTVSLFTVCFIVCQQAQANNKKAALDYYQSVIRGTVTDTAGKPLGGVSVKIEGKKTGTLTSQDGHFHIEANAGDVLEFDYIGYTEQKITVSGSDISVQLREVSSGLNDVVVVGYGTQKKADLTGAVATVSSRQLEDRPITNVSSSLQGLAPGVYIRQSSGAPNKNGASIQIRGVSSLNSPAVLVLVDGIIGSMDDVNPLDVESVTFLKDAASASIYGALAGSGVILVTTKKGKAGKPFVSYSGNMASETPTGLPDYVTNSVQYMNILNEAFLNVGVQAPFGAATIQAWDSAAKIPNQLTPLGVPNYVAYPNTNWNNVMFNNNWMQTHNVTLDGGDENTTYHLSLGYQYNPGLIARSSNTTYRVRANVESKIGKNITVGTQTFGYISYAGLANLNTVYTFFNSATPTIYPYYNGWFGGTSAAGDKTTVNNLEQYLYTTLGKPTPTTVINTSWYGKVNIIKGLTFEPTFNYQQQTVTSNTSTNQAASGRMNFLSMQPISPLTPVTQLTTSFSYAKTWSYTLQSLLRYNTTINNVHNIGAFVGFNQYYWEADSAGYTNMGLIDASVPAPSSATSVVGIPTGNRVNNAMRSLFGRLNYNYKDKYLLEANIRRDGASVFGVNNKYGNFPSVSVGWNLTKEAFLSGLQSHDIQALKLRASWGKNGNIYPNNYYPALYLYAPVPYSFGGQATTGIWGQQIPNASLQWESMAQTDIGIDATALRSRLDLTIDWYKRNTSGIIFQPPFDITAGAGIPPLVNSASMTNSGIELGLKWSDKVGSVSYSIGGNISYNYRNVVTRYKGKLITSLTTDNNGNKVFNTNFGAVAKQSGPNVIVEGHMFNEYYMQTLYKGDGSYKAGGTATATNGPKDGMIRTPDDLAWVQAMQADGHTFQPTNTVGQNQLYYGDFIYADNNGDGIYGNTNDQTFINKSPVPKIVYGFNTDIEWKGITFSTNWAGDGMIWYYWNGGGFNSNNIIAGVNIPVRNIQNRYFYDPNNPTDPRTNINGTQPRIKSSDAIDNVANNFWLYNAAYLRLTNLRIGYNLPEKMLGGLADYIHKVNVYVSGENLLTITKWPGQDPAMGALSGSNSYPTLKTYSLGLNVVF